MKKKYKVESQYKNPDVFIKALKAKLENSEANANQAWDEVEEVSDREAALKKEAYGNLELTWVDVQTTSMSKLSSWDARQCKVDSEVCIKGIITRVQDSTDRDERSFKISFRSLFIRTESA